MVVIVNKLCSILEIIFYYYYFLLLFYYFITIDSECRDVNSIVNHYDNTLSTILDKHAPLKKICIVDRPMNDWINADIQALKVIRRNKDDIWRKNPITYLMLLTYLML